MDHPEEDPEGLGATVKVKWFEPMVISLLGGKYKLKQNADGFTHSTKPTDHCIGILPPQSKMIDLDEVICQAGKKINQISVKILPADIDSQIAAMI